MSCAARRRRREKSGAPIPGALDNASFPRNAYPAFPDQPYRQGKAAMLRLEHSRGEARLVVALENRNRGLGDDRTGIHFGTDEMDRTAADPNTGRERAGVGVQSRESGQQGRMNVDHPVVPAFDEPWSEQAHEPGEADQPRARPPECRIQRALVKPRDPERPDDRIVWAVIPARAARSRPRGPDVRYHGAYLAGLTGFAQASDQGLQVGPASRNQNGESQAAPSVCGPRCGPPASPVALHTCRSVDPFAVGFECRRQASHLWRGEPRRGRSRN